MWEGRLPEVMDILRDGTKVARTKAAQTLQEVREAMQINYW